VTRRPLGLLVAITCCALVTGVLFAEDECAAHARDAAAPLLTRSAFAHGYLHGYEEGFHAADQDIHTGHTYMLVRAPERKMRTAYKRQFGDRELYLAGFREGARAGYDDSISGRAFRAIGELRTASASLNPSPHDHSFDRAFADGYFAGRSFGRSDAQPLTDFNFVGAICRASKRAPNGADYCDAYARGYRVGYGDGRTSSPTPRESQQTAHR
jgi:hypothetical protein